MGQGGNLIVSSAKAALAASLLFGLIASPAFAQSGPGGGSGAAVVQYDVELTVAPRCGWATGGEPVSTVNLGSLDISGSKDVPFALDCNTPFVIRAASSHGALKLGTALPPGLPASFSAMVPYNVRMRLGVRQANGNSDTRNRTCEASELLAAAPSVDCAFAGVALGEGWSSSNGVANANDVGLPASSLRLSWSAPTSGAATRIAGSYSDVLTVSVEAQS
jgi:hypothetical protein